MPDRSAGRGFVVLERDEWTGAGRGAVDSCVWQTAPCLATDAEQLTAGTDGVGGHWSVYGAIHAGAVAPAGANHVTVESFVAGTPTRRAAVVLAVP